jgi:hypothetical protein
MGRHGRKIERHLQIQYANNRIYISYDIKGFYSAAVGWDFHQAS